MVKKAAASTSGKSHVSTPKRTCQGGRRPKTSSMNKSLRRGYKRNRGQGR